MNKTEPFLPEHMRDAMARYIEDRIEPGKFLYAVLSNDLKTAVGAADHINLEYLTNIVSYCYNEIPGNAWGSEERVEQWLSQRIDE
jgi:hypothetical protein